MDFSQPNRTRSPKSTAQYYREIVNDNGFPSDETSQEVKGYFPCNFHWGIADSTLQVTRLYDYQLWKMFNNAPDA